MSRKIIYRKQLLQAVEAFLEGTPSSHIRAQRIIQRCYTDINSEVKRVTLDDIIWSFFVVALTDSIYYENRNFLHETREILLGNSSRTLFRRTVFGDDYRLYFTADEAEWYARLVSMVDFIITIPFAQIHEATEQARQHKELWTTMCASIPEAARAEQIDEESMQRKTLIEDISARSPSPENIGDEKIYHLILREVTDFLTNIRVGKPAAYFGYPIFEDATSYRGSTLSMPEQADATESIEWAKRLLDALAGKRNLYLSWRLNKAPAFGADVLLISLY